jgi:hypothetical protein
VKTHNNKKGCYAIYLHKRKGENTTTKKEPPLPPKNYTTLSFAMAEYFGRCIYALILNKTIAEFLFGKYVNT